MARAFYRGYVQDGPRAGQVKRLHIMREDGKWAGRNALCGVQAWHVTRSRTMILDPMPSVPPEGLDWCPTCVGQYADVVGLIGEIAFDLAGVA
jgi:hypothetical protein